MQCQSVMHRQITTSAARRAWAVSSRVFPSPEIQPAQWRSHVGHTKAGCVLEVTARTSHHGLAPKDSGLPLVQCPSMSRKPITISAAWQARAASSRVLPPPERHPAQWRSRACHAKAGCAVLEATARTSHHGLAPRVRRLPPVQCISMVREPITTSAARRARATSSRVSPPPERQPPQWRLFACHVNAKCALKVTARRSHHGHVPKERRFPLVRCPSVVRRPITASAVLRARGTRSRVLPTPERQPTQYRASTCHVKVGCVLEATSRTSHHGLTPNARGLPLVQYHYIVRSTTETSVARRARVASSRNSLPAETQPPKWGLRACHANVGCALEAKARTSHHGLASKEGGLPPVQYPLRCVSRP